MTFETILENMLNKVPVGIDKREGSVIYDALAPTALELSRLYFALDTALNETFIDTASREMAIKRAYERGIIPFPAESAVVRGEFDSDVPIGARFSLSDTRFGESRFGDTSFGDTSFGDNTKNIRFRVIETLPPLSDRQGFFQRKLVCEEKGTIGNRLYEKLIPIDYISGLKSAKIAEILIPGRDDEPVESIRTRYKEAFESTYFAGNVADYRRIALSHPGVGAVKIFPTLYRAGTVRIVVQGTNWRSAPYEVRYKLGTLLDPESYKGMGMGLAPIGHKVYVESTSEYQVNVWGDFIMREGATLADIRGELEEITDEYAKEVAKEWGTGGENKMLTVYISQIYARFISRCGDKILDIKNLSLIDPDAKQDLIFYDSAIPVGGSVKDNSENR